MNKILHDVEPRDFACRVFRQWSENWLLLSAGDFRSGKQNMMTVGWGSFGVIWGKPFAMILVRPQRFTVPFLENGKDFTLCGFRDEYRKALSFCGSKSGRDYPDKASAAGLTPCAAKLVSAPAYEEASLVLECRKVYRSELKAEGFLDPETLKANYPGNDLHIVWFGEILRCAAEDGYLDEK